MKKLVAILGVGLVALSACSKKAVKEDNLTNNPVTANADVNAAGDSDNGGAMGLKTVRFEYDSYTLNPENKATLDQNAKILKTNKEAKIQIEGHCDSRGGVQYNLGLGEKRASAAKKYLVAQGVAAKRVSTVSFGKERLLDTSETEEAHAKNRRATFVIVK